MTEQGAMLAFITLGLKEILLIAGVALALYGRSGSRLLRSTRYGRTIDPWLNLVRIPPSPRNRNNPRRGQDAPAPPARPRQGRVFWALALTAAAAVAAWVATRMVVLGGSH